MIKMMDLFAGIGGIRLGFEKAFPGEINTVYANDFDKYACETYKYNHSTEIICEDIRKINKTELPDIDICAAGFPCQPFSIAGKKAGFEDNYKDRRRGTLFAEVADICEIKQPKVILCENVKGLVRHRRGETIKVIIKSFAEIGYKVWGKVLNAKDFGSAQNRERVYIVAIRKDIAPDKFIFPDGDNSSMTVGDVLEDKVMKKYFISQTYLEALKRHKKAQSVKGNGYGYVVLDRQGKSNAIVCGGMGHERNMIACAYTGKNTDGLRKMTVREWARLQCFPDSFEFPVSNTQAYKQLGNSVCVNVIEAIARNLSDFLK